MANSLFIASISRKYSSTFRAVAATDSLWLQLKEPLFVANLRAEEIERIGRQYVQACARKERAEDEASPKTDPVSTPEIAGRCTPGDCLPHSTPT